tara:strand:- start:40 stop:540 length:501 start_codon:yes stop_codon:yes gene_type:complete
MSDNLKKHVDQFREEFEIFPFDEQMGWEELTKVIQPRKKSSWKIYVASGIAASVMFVAGWFSFMIYNSQNTTSNVAAIEWLETERYYQQEIDSKLTIVKSKVDDPRILKEFDEMDVTIKSLRDDLKDNMDNEEVIVAMMDSYRLKLRILEKMLDELRGDDQNSSSI